MIVYKQKYHLGCVSSKFAKEFDVNIEQAGYQGEIIEKSLGSSPVLRKDESKSGSIQGTSLELAVQADEDFELIEFYSANNRKHRISLYKDGEMFWTGFVLPEKYQEPYIAPPYDVVITASDGLGILKTIPFSYVENIGSEWSNVDRDVTLLSIIDRCLEPLGLSLGYRIAMNLRETRMNSSLSVLDQIYENPIRFNGMNCYDILDKILTSFAATITQVEGRWFIFRSCDLRSSYFEYSSNIVFEKIGTATLKKLGTIEVGDCYPIGSLNMEVDNAKKDIIVSGDYCVANKLPGTTGRPEYPQVEPIHDLEEDNSLAYSASLGRQSTNCLSLYEYYHEDLYCQISSSWLNKTNGIFEFGFNHQVAESCSFNIVVCFKEFTNGDFIDWFLDENGKWSKTRSSISIKGGDVVMEDPGTSFGEPRFDKSQSLPTAFSFKFNNIPASGNLYVFAYSNSNKKFGSASVDDTLMFPDIHGRNVYQSPEMHTTFLTPRLVVRDYYFKIIPENSGLSLKGIMQQNASESGGSVDSLFIDSPEDANSEVIYSSCLRLANRVQTKNWIASSSSLESTFLDILLKTLASRLGSVGSVLTGVLQGADIDFSSIIYHSYTNKYYYLSSAEYFLADDELSGKLVELPIYSDSGFNVTEEALRVSSNGGNEHRSVNGFDYRVYNPDGKGLPKRVTDLSPVNDTDITESFLELDKEGWSSSKRFEIEKIALLDRENAFIRPQVFKGDVYFLGNMHQKGKNYVLEAEHIISKKDFIDLRQDAISPVEVGKISGVRIRKADGENNLLFGAGSDRLMRIGLEGGELQAIMTREDNPLDMGVLHYDKKTRKSIALKRAVDSELLDGLSSEDYVQIKGEQTVSGIKHFEPTQYFKDIVFGENYRPGWEGIGGNVCVDKDGRISMEVDKLSVRQTARFYEMLVKKYRVVGGTLMVTNGEKSAGVEDFVVPGIFGMDGSFNVEGVLYRSLEFKI